MSPAVVTSPSERMNGMGSVLKCTPGTRLGSENDSESTMITVLSVSVLVRSLLMRVAACS